MSESFIQYEELWETLSQHFVLGPYSMHGPEHWKKVEANGLELAEFVAADKDVIRLFAVFHDSERRNEGYDPQHGYRAADLALELRGKLFQIADLQFDLLVQACQLHNHGQTSTEPTIGCCWDADRLELPRVGIRPAKEYMSTVEGKRRAE